MCGFVINVMFEARALPLFANSNCRLFYFILLTLGHCYILIQMYTQKLLFEWYDPRSNNG